MPTKTIILAHGFLGFGEPLGLPTFVNYFNGLAAHLRSRGHRVIVPNVNPIGGVRSRGERLAAEILALVPDGVRAHLVAHSMGGLDARHALTRVPGVAGRVATLVCVGTPHQGSPVADAVAAGGGSLLGHVPMFLLRQLERNAGALHDLTTGAAAAIDEATPDVASVRYIDIAGDASRGGHELLLFQLAAVIGRLGGETNDGVVARSSALKAGHEHLPDWPTDHAGEVGWSLDSLLPIPPGLPLPQPAHFSRYDAILDTL